MQIREKMILFPKINNYCKTIIINRESAKLYEQSEYINNFAPEDY